MKKIFLLIFNIKKIKTKKEKSQIHLDQREKIARKKCEREVL